MEPQPVVNEKQPAVEEVPVVITQPEEAKPAPVVYVPTVSFAEAADEIWPQLNNPQPLKEEQKPQEQPKVVVKEVNKPVKKAPIVKQEEVKSEPKVYIPTVSFNEAADEIWPQLNNPKPLPKEEKKPAPAPTPIKKPVAKKQPVVEEAKPDSRKVRARFKIYDGSEVVIFAKKEKPAEKVEPKKEEVKPAPKKEQTKPAPVKKPEPKVEEKKPVPSQNKLKFKHSRKGFRK